MKLGIYLYILIKIYLLWLNVKKVFYEKKIFYIFVYYKWNDRVILINVNEFIFIVLFKVKCYVCLYCEG